MFVCAMSVCMCVYVCMCVCVCVYVCVYVCVVCVGRNENHYFASLAILQLLIPCVVCYACDECTCVYEII
jgi:hypothetical protein